MTSEKILNITFAVQRDILQLLKGDHVAAMFLCQIKYWQERIGHDRYWYKTQSDWEEEMMISPYQQRRCRETFRQYDWYYEEQRGTPGQLYYRIDIVGLFRELQKIRAPEGLPYETGPGEMPVPMRDDEPEPEPSMTEGGTPAPEDRRSKEHLEKLRELLEAGLIEPLEYELAVKRCEQIEPEVKTTPEPGSVAEDDGEAAAKEADDPKPAASGVTFHHPNTGREIALEDTFDLELDQMIRCLAEGYGVPLALGVESSASMAIGRVIQDSKDRRYFVLDKISDLASAEGEGAKRINSRVVRNALSTDCREWLEEQKDKGGEDNQKRRGSIPVAEMDEKTKGFWDVGPEGK